jgi:hypothetical protein
MITYILPKILYTRNSSSFRKDECMKRRLPFGTGCYNPMNWINLLCSVRQKNHFCGSNSTQLIPVAARSKAWGLGAIACWDCGLESRRGHVCLYILIVVCWKVKVCAMGRSLILRSPTERVCVCVFVWVCVCVIRVSSGATITLYAYTK